MKNLLLFYLLFLPLIALSQNLILPESTSQVKIAFDFLKKIDLKADTFVGADDFGNIYYLKDQILYKKTEHEIYTYNNIQLGEISSVDIKNPLKILLFYRKFNTVILLDNRLNEMTTTFNFNNESFSKNMAFVSFSSNNNLWLYSYDDNVLSLWNYLSKKMIFTSQPLSSYFSNGLTFIPVQMVSNYKKVWLIEPEESIVLMFDEFGIFQDYYKYGIFELLKPAQGGEIILRNNELHFLIPDQNFEIDQYLTLDQDIVIESFYVNKKHIFIFDGNTIFVYKYLKK